MTHLQGLERDEVREKYQGNYECEASNGHSVDTRPFEFRVGENAVARELMLIYCILLSYIYIFGFPIFDINMS